MSDADIPHAHQTSELRGADSTARRRAVKSPEAICVTRCSVSEDSTGSLVSGGPELESETVDDTAGRLVPARRGIPVGLVVGEYRVLVPSQSLIQALDLNQAKNGSVVAIIVCVAVILLVLKFISSLVVRLVLSVVFAALGVVVYSQRASLVDCAEKISASVSADAATTAAEGVSCTFFGRDVKISLDNPVSPG